MLNIILLSNDTYSIELYKTKELSGLTRFQSSIYHIDYSDSLTALKEQFSIAFQHGLRTVNLSNV